MRRTVGLAVLVAMMAGAGAARADEASLYRGPGPRPGPDILYAGPAAAPQLTNAGVWRADPILVSGASRLPRRASSSTRTSSTTTTARGRRATPATRAAATTPSRAPTAPTPTRATRVYADNAADLVELRVKPLADATAFRLTLNSMNDAEKVAATIAIGSSAAPLPFPHGANATAPAAMFLTVHGASADLLDAVTQQPVAGGAPTASVDRERRQIEVRVPHAAWDPGRGTVRLAAGVGLWDAAAGAYLVPQGAARTATQPGGGRPGATAFFNAAFRFDEPLPKVGDPAGTAANPAWWRDQRQGGALQSGDLSPFHADVDFGKLADGTADESGVPRTGVLNRILASRFEPKQGVDFDRECGSSEGCAGELLGRLQPYALYVPEKAPAGGRYGLQLLLHSLGANYNQFSGSRNQSQFGDRGRGHIVMTPAGRGPDGWYYDRAGADTFEVWADVARHYALDPDVTSIAGYSMGGYGTYKLATQFPDLFAKGQPTVGPPGLGVWVPPNPPQPGGDRSLTFRQLASLRHIPFLIWNASGDQLVPLPGPQQQAQGFDDLGYRYEFDVFSPAEHLTLAIHDQFAPAAQFLGDAAVKRDPAHVSYVRNPTMDFPDAGTTADHAYWLSAIALREGGGDAPLGTLDAVSGGIPEGDAPAGETQRGGGSLGGGNLGTLAFTSQAPSVGRDAVEAAHRRAVAEGPQRRHGDRAPRARADHLRRGADGRHRRAGAGRASPAAGGRRRSPARARSRARARRARARRASGARPCARAGAALRVAFSRALRRKVTVDVLRHSRGTAGAGQVRRVKRFAGRTRSFTWTAAAGRRGRRATSRCGCACACPAAASTSGASCSSAAPAAASCAGRPPCAAPRAGCSRASCSARRCSAARRKRRRPSTSRWRAPPAPASTCCAGGGSCGRCSACGASAPGARGALSLPARSLPRGRYRIRLTIRRAGAPARSVALVTRRLWT